MNDKATEPTQPDPLLRVSSTDLLGAGAEARNGWPDQGPAEKSQDVRKGCAECRFAGPREGYDSHTCRRRDGSPLTEGLGPRWWQCSTHGRAHANAWGCPECVRELRDENTRMRRALAWLEEKARACKLEIAPSIYGSGFEFGFWPQCDAKVVTAKTLLEAVEAAQRA